MFAELAERLIPLGGYILTAINTGFPISHDLTFLTFVRLALLRLVGGRKPNSGQSNPNPSLYYTTKLWICQAFRGVHRRSIVTFCWCGGVTFICDNVAECYVKKF